MVAMAPKARPFRLKFCYSCLNRIPGGTVCEECAMERVSLKRWAGGVAAAIGRSLKQEYRFEGGRWWLYTLGRAVRQLTDEEVVWHAERNHAPFMPGGLTSDDPRWWDEPEGR